MSCVERKEEELYLADDWCGLPSHTPFELSERRQRDHLDVGGLGTKNRNHGKGVKKMPKTTSTALSHVHVVLCQHEVRDAQCNSGVDQKRGG